MLNDLARRLASCDPRWCVSEYRDRDVTWAQPGRQRRPVASAILPVILAGSSVLGGSLTCGRSRARRGLRGEDRRLRRCGSPRREVTLVATLRPPNRRPVDAVADRVPTSVSTAFALWMVALTAGLFETVLAVMAVAVGRDIPVSSRSITHEVDDVVAAARAVGEPVVLYGHSDGAVIALEALAASPASFSGAVIFEPPVAIGSALSGEDTRPGQAMAVFSHRVVGLTSWQARLVGLAVTLLRKYRRLVPGQIRFLGSLGSPRRTPRHLPPDPHADGAPRSGA